MSIANCATDIIPVGSAIKIGIGIVSMMSDIAQNYDADQKCREVNNRKRFKTRTVVSLDPNEKVGNMGYSDNHYINAQEMAYTIYFENKATATANAIEVFIKDTLNPAIFDFKKLRFSSFSFGDTTFYFVTDTNYVYKLFDLYPKKDIKVEFTASVDSLGIVRWKIASLDRLTNELIDDPDRGFLPPNINSPDGEGSVSFTVPLVKNLSSGTIVDNKAEIIFDLNQPIVTNTFSNILDLEPPVSSLSAKFDSINSIIILEPDGYDLISDIFSYSLKVSKDNGIPYPFATVFNSNAIAFRVNGEGLYKFYGTAADNAGNTEKSNDIPKASVFVSKTNIASKNQLSRIKIYPNPADEYLNVALPNNTLPKYVVQNLYGNVVMEGIMSNSSQKVNISNLAAGIYFIKFTENSQFQMFKFIKE